MSLSPEPGTAHHHRDASPTPIGVLLRALGTAAVCSVMFAAFVGKDGVDEPLTPGPWLSAVALSGVFVLAWVARDTPQWRAVPTWWAWLVALIVAALVLGLLGLVTDTERSRAPGWDATSAFGTSGLVVLCLLPAVGLGIAFGRAVVGSAQSQRSSARPDR